MPISEDRRPATGTEAPLLQRERAIELDFHGVVGTRDLPRVRPAQPIVRLFLLPAVPDRLFEHAVFIAQAISHGRQLHRGHRIEKARRQTPESAVPQSGIRFLLKQAQPVDIFARDDLLHHGTEEKVDDIVGQRPSDQEFHR